MNTPGGLRNIVLDGGPDPPRRGEGELGETLPIVDSLYMYLKNG